MTSNVTFVTCCFQQSQCQFTADCENMDVTVGTWHTAKQHSCTCTLLLFYLLTCAHHSVTRSNETADGPCSGAVLPAALSPVSENEAGVKDLKRREEEVTLALKGCFTRLCGKRRRGLKANERASILYDDHEIDVCVHLLVTIKYCQRQVDDHEVRWASLQ